MKRDIWAVVPIKEIENAKSRLASAYSPSFRKGLALAMAHDVLSALADVRELAGIVVVTRDADAIGIARRYDAEIFDDDAGAGHTGAVMGAVRRFVREGRGGLLTVPGDIPYITAEETSQLISAHRDGRAFSIVPAHDMRGSNAILLTPPDAVPLAFGDDSFYPHLDAARRLGIEPTVLRLPGIGLDIDHPADLEMLMRQPKPTFVWRYLVDSNLVIRTSDTAPREICR